jgi:hypothetical protein
LYDPLLDQVFVQAGSECLGADDGAGVWIMMMMIEYGIPGYYIFYRGEEVGGQGSRWIASNMKNMLARYDRVIAFDRKGQTDIITHQGGQRTASDEFAKGLAASLSEFDPTLKLKGSANGSFTDSKNYMDIIPECTNISVGYMHQHGNNEYQHVGYLWKLMQAAINIDWEKLPTSRDPKEVDNEYYGWGYSNYQYSRGTQSVKKQIGTAPKYITPETKSKPDPTEVLGYDEVEMLMKRYPEVVAELLVSHISWSDVDEALLDHYTLEYLDVT